MLVLLQLTVECVPLAPVLSSEELPAEDARKFGPKITKVGVVMSDEF